MKVLAFVFILLSSYCVLAQQDSSTFDKKALIAPSIMISYGLAGTYTDIGQQVNRDIKSVFYTPGQRTHSDDYLIFVPSVAVYGLNIVGVKGKHNFKDRTILLGTSYTMLLPVVLSAKEFILRLHLPVQSFSDKSTSIKALGTE